MRFLCALSLVVLTTFSTGAYAGNTLSAGQVKALFPGNFQAVWKEKKTLTLVADAKGGLVGSMGILSGNGRWWIKGSHLCIAFDPWKDEKVRCSRVVREGSWYHSLYRESGTPRLRFKPI